MKKGTDLIAFANTFIGRPYIYGVLVPKDDAEWKGGFDCAEFAAYCNYQIFGILYGTESNNPKNAHTTNAYTGYFKKDAKALGKEVPVAVAARIPGAMLLRYPAPGADGHIVFVAGENKTIEAASTKLGVKSLGISGRDFDIGILLPGVVYDEANLHIQYEAPKIVYKLKSPMMKDAYIESIQKALGFKDGDVDGVFGGDTNAAVVAFQRKNKLVVDGQIVPGGETAKALKIA